MSARIFAPSAFTAALLLFSQVATAQPPAAPKPAPAATQASAPAAPEATGRRPQPVIAKESLRAIRERGSLRACVAPYTPWVISGAKDGELTGFSVDLARQLAADLGVEVEFVGGGYPDLIPALAEGDCDVVPGGIAATPDRALFVHFSAPVALHEVQVVGPASAIGEARKASEVNPAGLTVGAVSGSAELQDARRLMPTATVQEFESAAALADALLSGKVRAAVSAAPLPEVFARLSGGKFTIAPEPLSVRGEAFAVRRGDLEFLAYLNSWVQARTFDGWLKERANAWFVTLDWVEGLTKPTQD
jgi:polar amino acid transport system substrate-binding protein